MDVWYSSRHLTSNRNPWAMSLTEEPANDDLFTRTTIWYAVLVPTAFDSDHIITRAYVTVFYAYIIAGV